MKKEIEIEFKYLKATLKENLIIDVYINDEKADEITLKKDCVFLYADIPVCLILGIEDRSSLKDYLDIPGIKKLYDEHFNKPVDLFGFVSENNNKAFKVDEYGRCERVSWFGADHISRLKANYNLFPSEETCVNAIPMSLDERKQYLFAIAKGYEVLTCEEAQCNCENHSLYYNGILEEFVIQMEMSDLTPNIYFKHLDHAKECAYFMNESEDDE